MNKEDLRIGRTYYGILDNKAYLYTQDSGVDGQPLFTVDGKLGCRADLGTLVDPAAPVSVTTATGRDLDALGEQLNIYREVFKYAGPESDARYRNKLLLMKLTGWTVQDVQDELAKTLNAQVACNPEELKWTVTRGLLQWRVYFSVKRYEWSVTIERVAGNAPNIKAETLYVALYKAVAVFRGILAQSDPRPDELEDRLKVLLESANAT